jgi:hypothetical protein
VALQTVPQSYRSARSTACITPGWLQASVGMREHFVAA